MGPPENEENGTVLLLRSAVLLGGMMLTLGLLSASPVRAQPASLEYTVSISGVPEEGLADLLKETSQLVSLRDKPPSTLAGLRRRVDDDVARLTETLRSQGFYKASVKARIDPAKTPVAVEVKADPGVLYLLAEFRIHYPDVEDRTGLLTDMEALDLHAGMPAEGTLVVTAQGLLIRRLAEHGRPRAKVLDRKVVVDHSDTTMSVDLTVDPGPLVRFGPAEFRGLKTVKADYLRRLVPWKEGAIYDQKQVDAFTDRLWGTDLFRTVSVALTEDDDGAAPVIIDLTEREHRTISAGIGYSSDRGLGGDVSWEHRNLFGRQENLSVALAYDQVEQSLSGNFRKPNFRRLDQTGLLKGTASREDTDAYKERKTEVFLGLERKFAEVWTARAGPSLEYALIDDVGDYENFLIAGFPVSVSRDTTDDRLDPTKGTRLSAAVTPAQGMLARGVTFLTSELSGSAYYSVLPEDGLVLAGRFRVASLTGASTREIPASKRLYAGGGGSVRGYEYQSLGPLDDDGDPVGGRSAVELGFETRFRLSDSFGIVPFLEGGNVFDDEVPDPGNELQWATGLGVRYFTPVGPLRLDVAFPIDRRAGVDDRFEFYVSLGQAF